MRIAFVADIPIANHKRCGGEYRAGINDRARACLSAFSRAVDYANKVSCRKFVILGDLFDATDPSPQLIGAVQEVLDKFSGDRVVLLGNHEASSDLQYDNALYPLQFSATVADRPMWISNGQVSILAVPFRAGAAQEWLPGVLQKLTNGRSKNKGDMWVLAVHMGIVTDETAPFLQGSKDSITSKFLLSLMDQYRIDFTTAGNWHEYLEVENRIFQVGSLCPTGWANKGSGPYGNVLILDSGKQAVLKTIPGPRFYSVESKSEFGELELAPNSAYIEWRAAPGQADEVEALLQEHKQSGAIADYTVRSEKKVDKSVKKVRESASLEEALLEDVRARSFSEGVDRQVVLDRACQFLKVRELRLGGGED